MIGTTTKPKASGKSLKLGDPLARGGAAHAETTPPQPAAIQAVTNTSFPPLKQIDAGVLNIGYAKTGPPDGPQRFPVIELAGEPQRTWSAFVHGYVSMLVRIPS